MSLDKREKLPNKHNNTDPDYLRVQHKAMQKTLKEQAYHKNVEDREKSDQEIVYAFKQVFKTEEGKIVLKHLEDLFRFNRSCFASTPRDTDFALGNQAAIIYIHEKINQELKEETNVR